MKTLYNQLIFCGVVILSFACVDDLDVVPLDTDEQTSATLFTDPEAYRQVLAKIYGGLALTGQQGPAGQADIQGIDEGFSSYLRMLWYHQELSTDEALIGWNDQTIKDFHEQDWGSSDLFIRGMYSRIFYQITLANEFIRQASEENISGFPPADQAEITEYLHEARFLRALSYWHAMDLFGNVPFVTEEHEIGAFLPEQASRADVYSYIESELLDLESKLPDARTNEYARADKAAAWMLLAKLYLNAEVYIQQPKYTECLTYCNKVINAGYLLDAQFSDLFVADNHQSQEVILPIAFDGLSTQSWGGTTFIIHAAVGGNMSPGNYGVDGGWGGIRTTSALVNKFADETGDTDSRAMFFTDGQSLEITDVSTFTDGYAVTKFTNLNADSSPGTDATFVDTDFPIFRLADAYLMYAESVLRGGTGGDQATAIAYINQLRERAYGNADGNITGADLNLDFILDERARELYWECHRRTDLIRFNSFSESQYLWPWKGGVAEGISVSSIYDLFPIPAADLAANPNLSQNTGY